MRRFRYPRCPCSATCPLGLSYARCAMASGVSLLGGRVVDGSEPPAAIASLGRDNDSHGGTSALGCAAYDPTPAVVASVVRSSGHV